MDWHRLPAGESLERLGSAREGLSSEEARRRLERHGPNTVGREEKVSPLRVLVSQFRSPLIYVLLAALAVTLAIRSWSDAIVIGAVLVVNAAVGFLQEYRAESAVRALMQMVSPRARVRRDGEVREVPSERIVPGDVVLLAEGEVIPADLRLLSAKGLQVDESALTGESVPAPKQEAAQPEAPESLPASDIRSCAFMGTAVTSGRAEAVVFATGRGTRIGGIAEEMRKAGEVRTPLQHRMDRLARWIAVLILGVASISFGVGWWIGRSVEEMFLLAVALAVAAMPAGLPVVMTVALAVGVQRMARRHAVIRHLPAVETLGSTTAIVSDKTGTLTRNRMTVRSISAGGERFAVSGAPLSERGGVTREGDDRPVEVAEGGALHTALLAGLLCNDASLAPASGEGGAPPEAAARERDEAKAEPEDGGELRAKGDPLEVALLVSASKAGLDRRGAERERPRTDQVPFRTERRFAATIHEGVDGVPLVLVKGAPEVVAAMCERALSAEGEEEPIDRDAVLAESDTLASRGLRVIAMARGRGEAAVQAVKSDTPQGLVFGGLQGMLDPPRPEAVEAVDRCHEAGIRVLMVTGDHARTAAAIARATHLDRPVAAAGGAVRAAPPPAQTLPEAGPAAGAEAETPGGAQAPEDALPPVCTGRELAELEDASLDDRLREVNVFARVRPRAKTRLVERLKALGNVVAVTGDGVNDAPALKAAHLGASMGSGTDVAKEASDMVITDDDFASVYSAVEEGRTAFRNIRMATFFLLSTGAADVLIILTALGIGWPLPLLPAQILWCNVVTNGIADVALGFEPGERALFRRPPRPPGEGVLDRTLLERLVVVGVWLAAGTLGVFHLVRVGEGASLELARVAALTTLVLFQKVHVFNCRSEDLSLFRKSLLANKVLFLGVLSSLAVHVAALYIPWTQTLLRFQPLSLEIWGLCAAVAATAIVVNELHKWLRPRPRARA